jgi:hypothetical protein
VKSVGIIPEALVTINSQQKNNNIKLDEKYKLNISSKKCDYLNFCPLRPLFEIK